MEFGLMLLGLAGLVAVIGGFVGFFSLFSSANKDNRVRDVEKETAKLNLEMTKLSMRLEALRKTVELQPQQAPPSPAAALAVNTPKANMMPAENFPDNLVDSLKNNVQLVSDEELTQQAMAAEASTDNTALAAAVAKPIAPPISKPAFKPAEPNFIERGIAAAKAWLFGGNTMVRAGIIVLFIGISF